MSEFKINTKLFEDFIFLFYVCNSICLYSTMAVYVMLVSELMMNKSFDSEHYKSPNAKC